MTQSQNVEYDMYERVIKCCNENTATVTLNPAFQADLALLESKVAEINRLLGLLESGNAHSETKQDIKTAMVAFGLDVCTNLFAYGLVIQDKAIQKLSKHTKTSLGTGKEEEILQRCQNIAKKARELMSELQTKRGMQETLLTKFEESIVQFKAIKPEPRSAIQEKSTLIEEMAKAFEGADLAMTLLTSSAVNLKGIADDFYARFDKATGTISPRTSTTKIKFDVTDGITNEKITDYQYESTALNLNKTMMNARSLLIPTPHHEGSDFAISSEGYETAVKENVKIIKGKINIIKVVLMPMKAA